MKKHDFKSIKMGNDKFIEMLYSKPNYIGDSSLTFQKQMTNILSVWSPVLNLKSPLNHEIQI